MLHNATIYLTEPDAEGLMEVFASRLGAVS